MYSTSMGGKESEKWIFERKIFLNYFQRNFKLFSTKLGKFSKIKLKTDEKGNPGAILGFGAIFGSETSLR